jgi:hypothetical protein
MMGTVIHMPEPSTSLCAMKALTSEDSARSAAMAAGLVR